MYCDYHTHTPLCLHAEGSAAEYAEAAKLAGLLEYGISDHAPMPREPFDDWRMKQADLPRYYEWIAEAKEAAGESLSIRAGLECDWVKGGESWTEQLRGCYEWDYLIGSVHYLDGLKEFDNPFRMSFWENTRVEDAWAMYWQLFTEMAASGQFHILGHADLIKKFGFRPSGDLRRYYEPAIQAMLDAKATLELNTAGWYNKCAEQYPADEFLQMAAQAGIPLTISSDAHKPEHVARDFSKAAQLAKNLGFKELVRYCKGERTLYPLQTQD